MRILSKATKQDWTNSQTFNNQLHSVNVYPISFERFSPVAVERTKLRQLFDFVYATKAKQQEEHRPILN